MKRVLRVLALVLVLLSTFSLHADAATYQVTNTADIGAGSLRAAIDLVNGNPGPHRIVFAISAVGVQTIHLASPLPDVTTTVAIDGTTQPGFNQTPLIEVRGDASNLPLTIAAPHSSVKGLVLNNFTNACLNITADVCTVSTCFIGTNSNATGTIPNGGEGIYVVGKGTLIGGRIRAFGNIISGNVAGIYIDSASERDTVMGNYIGTDVSGTIALPNQQGIFSSTARNVLIENNLISGNTYNGIYVECGSGSVTPAEGVRIYRNWIGTDASGMTKLANAENGIKLLCDYSVVGGIGKGNVISGNGLGIYVTPNSAYNQILGNYIGVSADGTLPVGNATPGIYLAFSHDNMIGGDADGTGNIIGGNGSDGIAINNPISTDNTIQGNAIGTSFNGALSLGNTAAGINTSGDRTIVGGLGTLGNIIANNYGGVLISGVQTTVRGNSIFGNTFELWIDLAPFFFSPNDTLDTDEGGNHLQNFPTISSVSLVSGQVRLKGYLSSVPAKIFTLDFYSNTSCNPEGHGEGETWLGSSDVITNGSGLATFDIPYPLSSLRGGYIFTATATDDGGSTSEFSACAPLGLTPTAAEPGPHIVFSLGATTPSPAQGTTTLPFTLPVPSHVSLRAYDVSGRLVSTLAEADYSAGQQRAKWSVEHVPRGVYFCRLQARANDGSGQSFEASRTVIVAP